MPIINKYTNISMLEGIKNINDSDEYYVINLNELDIDLNYGKDFEEIINNRNIEDEISDLVDVYIINKQSHTIYYPKGVEYNGKIHYKDNTTYSSIYTGLKVGDYVQYEVQDKSYTITSSQTGYDSDQTYNTNTYDGLWRVLYNDSINGLQIVSVDLVASVYMKGEIGYNNFVDTLNDMSENYVNTTFAISGRLVGSDPVSPEGETDIYSNSTYSFIGELANNMKVDDNTYSLDYNALANIGENNIGSEYWMASRYIYIQSKGAGFCGTVVDEEGEIISLCLRCVHSIGKVGEHAYNKGVRPVIKLKSNVITTSGSGTESSPYILGTK